ncbi:hypothetical protein PROFUN_07267 [Planoprotostelium fungivorum]|uniref:Uncharacterized protein n=1 Tax=Planoprotostelium fungivorum TaxID=1890364 RepID=A0A2P6NMA6_9EUKA|nr:hypothetical protein PROFUN_07267 [Planoprotostelium fungivorum]
MFSTNPRFSETNIFWTKTSHYPTHDPKHLSPRPPNTMDKFLVRPKRKAEEEPATASEDAQLSSPKKSAKSETDVDQKTLAEWLSVPVETLTTDQQYEDYFTGLAERLLNHTVLKVNRQPHRLLEIEFYFTNEKSHGLHYDPFTHCDDIQKQNAVWYFHRTKGSYRGGTYKGLDITIGRGEGRHGGILIRSVQALQDGKIICGPSLSVDHLLSVCKAEDIKTLVNEKMQGDISVFPSEDKSNILVLEDSNNTFDKKPVYRSGRVGLHMTKKVATDDDKTAQMDFVFKNYRYFCEAKKISKGNHYASTALLWRGMSPKEIANILPTKLTTIEKYRDLFEEGKKMKEEKFLGTKMTDSQICQAIGSLHNRLTW